MGKNSNGKGRGYIRIPPVSIEAQRAKENLDDHPQHTRAEQHKDEHEHQHDSGGDEKLNHGNTSLF